MFLRMQFVPLFIIVSLSFPRGEALLVLSLSLVPFVTSSYHSILQSSHFLP